MCVGAEEVLDVARPKKANKSKGKKKQSKHKNNKQTFYGCHCRKLGLGLSWEREGNQVQEFSFRGICLCVFMSSG